MPNPLNRMTPLTTIVVAVVLTAFAVLGITNAEHAAAKIVYAILIVVGLTLLAVGVTRKRHAHKDS